MKGGRGSMKIHRAQKRKRQRELKRKKKREREGQVPDPMQRLERTEQLPRPPTSRAPGG